jgi:hypothetical protein
VTSHDPRADPAFPPGRSQSARTEPGTAAQNHLPDAAFGPTRPAQRGPAVATPASIQAARRRPLTWKTVLTRAAAGVAIYLVLPCCNRYHNGRLSPCHWAFAPGPHNTTH